MVIRAKATLIALLTLTGGCTPDSPTVLVVNVTARPGVHDVANLDVSFAQGADTERTLLGKSGQTITLPASFVIRADGRAGPATVTVKAKDKDDRLRAEGSQTATVLADEEVPLTVLLYPADFPANDRYQASQIFSTGVSGRQLGSNGKGSLVGVWEDQQCPLSRCDVYYRMWDAQGNPRLNGVTNKTEEHIANNTTAYYDTPTVAMQSSGQFVAAWYRQDSTASTYEIRSRAFLANGRPDDQSNSTNEVTLSESLSSVSSPDIAALGDGNYVVVWHQEKNNEWQVMGRYLDAHGRAIAPKGGQNQAFVIAKFAKTGPDPNPAVAAGNNVGGFMVVWRQQGPLWGRTYAPGATPNSATFGISGSAKVGGLNAGPMLNGYAVVWDDANSCGQDSTPPCIRFRRYNLVGAAQEEAWTLNTTTAGKQTEPAVAMGRAGALLAVWTSEDGGSDPGAGIRGRPITAVGLPVGDDYVLNTTTMRDQDSPSVAPHNTDTDSFAILFRDDSQLGPDTDQAAIRGRLLYPDMSPRNGLIGSLCDNGTPCKTGLKCVNSGVGNRCVRTCSGGASAVCPDGGKCSQLSGGLGTVCIYQ